MNNNRIAGVPGPSVPLIGQPDPMKFIRLALEEITGHCDADIREAISGVQMYFGPPPAVPPGQCLLALDGTAVLTLQLLRDLRRAEEHRTGEE